MKKWYHWTNLAGSFSYSSSSSCKISESIVWRLCSSCTKSWFLYCCSSALIMETPALVFPCVKQALWGQPKISMLVILCVCVNVISKVIMTNTQGYCWIISHQKRTSFSPTRTTKRCLDLGSSQPGSTLNWQQGQRATERTAAAHTQSGINHQW